MKILFITNRFPLPTNRGDRVRTYNIAKILAENNEVTLCAFNDEPVKEEYLVEAQKIFKDIHLVKPNIIKSLLNVIAAVPAQKPLQVAFYKNNEMSEKINALGEFDLVYTFHLRMAPYGVLSDAKYKILDMTDAVSGFMLNLYKHGPLLYKPIGYLEHIRTKRYENNIAVKFNESWVVSAVEKETLITSGCPGTINIIPNGVNDALFSTEKRYLQGYNIVFVGYMGVESVDAVKYFYKQIWPLVKAKISKATFTIVGANPPKEIRGLHNGIDVLVTGFVPDLADVYAKATLAVAPMRFVVGVQNKILEAMALGTPVVSTTMGNGGIKATNGKEIVLADNAVDFAKAVVDLLNDDEKRNFIAKNGKEYVKKNFTWDIAKKRVNEIEESLKRKDII